ncbi:hypothetical protein BST81_18790 [Leptolyngbya sp. 'hensonii']|uniref:hypothetical protein n=1 Tax=Leptolyngbya sp. 'hensonii' TaxID=1922337 RepID=UPI00094FE513|nr:hypothetical protein [Leptolyngbya sp. 'hensonii']OLP17023.1 hypothetical protein BST81_18790 [Leptolyngbya sp. 'hensonii']
MNYKRLMSRVSLACLTIVLMERLDPLTAKAEAVRPLYAGGTDWVRLTINRPGGYILEATSVLGDVDVELYDTTGQRFARGKKLGNETIFFNVPSGAEGVFRVRYSMPICVNPLGACNVNINLYPQ